MPVTPILAEFKASLGQCETLIATAHKTDASGAAIFSAIDKKQITVAAFLNVFIAWETFLESSLVTLMMGATTTTGRVPVRYVTPPTVDVARQLVTGVMRYFDYGNHDNFRKIVKLYFQAGYPYEPHISSIASDLSDLRTLRNASAHITSTTQTALDGLALRVFARPHANIELYAFLTMNDPRTGGGTTVFQTYKSKLSVAAELIAAG